MYSALKALFLGYVFFFQCLVHAQIFIPHAFWQDLEPCKTAYCPIPNPVAATLQGTGGMTQVVNTVTCAGSGGAGDDEFVQINLPFNFAINSLANIDWYLGSNTYITAGAGSTVYNSLSGSNPAIRKFHLGAADNSWKSVYTISGLNYFRIRYEGKANTNCSSGTDIIYEFTFYRPAGMISQYAVVVFGTHGRTGGQFGVASNSAYLLNNTGSLSANQSYLFTSNNSGVTWTSQAGWSISGTGTGL